jgi:glucokinase
VSATLAIDIGGTKFAVALFDGPRIVRRMEWPTDRSRGPAGVLPQIESIARGWQQEWAVARCGVGFGGPVDFSAQRVARSTHAGGWEDYPLRGHLEARLGLPVIIDNDANAGALGEARFGAGRGRLPLFYMTLSTGIGGGLILADGQVYRGANHWSAEIGHMTIRPDGPECLCGARGCLERLCCGLWLERDYGRPPAELFEDPEFVARYVVDLALGVKAAIMILNPARVVVGGGLTRSGKRLFEPLRKELARQMPPWSGAVVDVQPAALGADHVLWGAYALAATLSS